MKKLIVANWKENPGTEAAGLKLFHAVAKAPRGADVVICPPFVYLEEISRAFKKLQSKKNLALGAQDVFWEEGGAFTGTAGPKMLRSVGVRYVIIGHSERRRVFNETDAMVNKKIKLALKDGLKVVLCVGEPIAIRKKGIAAAETFIKNQLKNGLAGVRKDEKIIVAYEPIWAIGSGKNDNPEDATTMAKLIKKHGVARFLYGGSVTSKNIADYVHYKSIDGALVGGASLKAQEFNKILDKIKN
jgi:triosephosphate isomerase (TIM)